MRYHAEYVCPDVDSIHGGDPFACPDRLVERRSDGSYVLLIHDGTGSGITIAFCPWCSTALEPGSGDIPTH
jgi:hypothetical protein